jgi:hypothetical protein
MYKIINATVVIRTTDSISIPADPQNTDYSAYLQWLAEDNTPEPADQLPPQDYAAQILSLERENMMPRITREFMLLDAVAKAAAQGITEPQLYAGMFAYQKLKDFDMQIAALRSQIV